MKQRHSIRFAVLAVMLAALFASNLYVGSVSIPFADVTAILFGDADLDGPMRFIVVNSRLPQGVTAMLAGAALTVAGLMLQTAFRNPLAGPSILGISSGAGLGVAFVMLLGGGTLAVGGMAFGGHMAVLAAAFAGSVAVMGLLLLFAVWLKNDLMLLITGIMVGYLTSSVVTLLSYLSSAEGVQGYVMWGMGNFSGVGLGQLPLFGGITLAGMALAVLLVKPLNIMLLGYNYARNLGVDMTRLRNLLLLTTGILTATVTAYCGPVSFIGLAVPHIARMVFRTADHRVIIPGCMLVGGIAGLLCNLLCVVPARIVLPLNAVTPIIGVPVILYVILKQRIKKG